MLYSEFGIFNNISQLFDLIDDISLMIISKKNCVEIEPISEFALEWEKNLNIEIMIIDKFRKLRNSILDKLIDRSSIIFYDKLFAETKPHLLQRVLYSFLS